MTLHPAAFRESEYAKLASEDKIRSLQKKFADNWILFAEVDMHQHAGKFVRILQNAFPISGVAYVLEEVLIKERTRNLLPGVWTEEAIFDHNISENHREEPWGQLANQIYVSSTKSLMGPGLVNIHDKDKRLVCCFRDDNAFETSAAVNRIAALRCRGSFEQYFGFDGDYQRGPEAT